MTPAIPAIRGYYSRSQQVRIVLENCVLDTDMHYIKVKPHETYTLVVCGKEKEKKFKRIDLDGKHFLVDAITGTLYNAVTGESLNPHLYIRPFALQSNFDQPKSGPE